MNISQELQHGGVLKWWYPKNHRFHFQKGQTLDDLGVPPVYRCSLYHIISITWKSNHLNLAQKSVSAKLQAIFKGYPKMDRRWFSSNIDDPSTGFHHIPSTARLIWSMEHFGDHLPHFHTPTPMGSLLACQAPFFKTQSYQPVFSQVH